MMMVEVEPEDFIRGLRLLHSRSPESSDELKKLLDYYHSRKVNFGQDPRRPALSSAFSSIKPVTLEESSSSSSGGTKKSKITEDDSEATDVEDNEISTSTGNDTGLDFHHPHPHPVDICCTICKLNESNNNNRILECQECHLFYHQECHKPPVPKKDLNDPRNIWYCFKCKAPGKKISGAGKFLSGSGTSKMLNNKTAVSSVLHSSSNSSSPIDDKLKINDSEHSGGKSNTVMMKRPKIAGSSTSGSSSTFGSSLSSNSNSSSSNKSSTNNTVLGAKRNTGSMIGTGSAYDKRTAIGLKKSKFSKL